MRIAILHQAVAGDAAPDDRDVLAQAEAVGAALTELGHRWERLACTLDLSRVERFLSAFAPDLVFNLVESLAGTGRLIHLVPALLDAAAIPYTGALTEAVLATSHKLIAKERLAAAGLPTPPWIGPLPPDLPALFGPADAAGAGDPGAPWLVKSLWEHASIGLDAAAVVRGAEAEVRAALAAQAARMGGACFAEKYIEGREFNLSLLAAPGGPEVLPPAEILFEGFPPESLRIVGYRAKWDPDSFEYRHTVRRFAFPDADAPLLERLGRLAGRCWELFGLHGYARVDFRVDERGEPWILEINANPCLSPDAGFAAALAAGGIGFAQAVARILEDPGGRGTGRRAASAAAPPAPGGVAGIRLRRQVAAEDAVRIRELVAATGHFYPAEVKVAVELVEERLAKGPACGYDFVLAEADGELLGYACFGPVPMAPGSFDLYWIAVAPSAQKRGVGRLLLREAEGDIRRAGGARLYAETSGRPLYAGTRGFYERTGFFAEARLEDFYGPGDPKIIYTKALAAS